MGETVHSDAVYALNSYIWKVVEANLGWDKANYGNRAPIVPANQHPEFLQYNKPFIVFGSAVTRGLGGVPYLSTETVAYTIYATTATEANQIMRTLVKALEWMDETAKWVNEWIVEEGLTRVGGERKIRFRSITVTQATSAGPQQQEAGRVDAQVMLHTQYIDLGEMKVRVADFD